MHPQNDPNITLPFELKIHLTKMPFTFLSIIQILHPRVLYQGNKKADAQAFFDEVTQVSLYLREICGKLKTLC
jgi:hypothetical protein